MPYLRLWHGHHHPEEQLDGWGTDGPIFGPFPFFHMTYACEIQFGDEGHCLTIVDDFVFYDGMFYGDWSFSDQLDEGMRLGLVTFDADKAVRADCRRGTHPPGSSQNEGGASKTGVQIMDPQVAWQELIDAFCRLDWDRVRDLADGLLQWMNRGGSPPETSAMKSAVTGKSADPPQSPGPDWNRIVAQAACRYALVLADQVLADPNGIPHGVPFTLSCCSCDADNPHAYDEAVDAGWTRIRFVPQSPGENFLGLCPECRQLGEELP